MALACSPSAVQSLGIFGERGLGLCLLDKEYGTAEQGELLLAFLGRQGIGHSRERHTLESRRLDRLGNLDGSSEVATRKAGAISVIYDVFIPGSKRSSN